MDCAEGTICTPSGLTDDFHVEHDGSVNGGSSGGGGGGSSRGPRDYVSVYLLAIVVALWASWGVL